MGRAKEGVEMRTGGQGPATDDHSFLRGRSGWLNVPLTGRVNIGGHEIQAGCRKRGFGQADFKHFRYT